MAVGRINARPGLASALNGRNSPDCTKRRLLQACSRCIITQQFRKTVPHTPTEFCHRIQLERCSLDFMLCCPSMTDYHHSLAAMLPRHLKLAHGTQPFLAAFCPCIDSCQSLRLSILFEPEFPVIYLFVAQTSHAFDLHGHVSHFVPGLPRPATETRIPIRYLMGTFELYCLAQELQCPSCKRILMRISLAKYPISFRSFSSDKKLRENLEVNLDYVMTMMGGCLLRFQKKSITNRQTDQ